MGADTGDEDANQTDMGKHVLFHRAIDMRHCGIQSK